ncbi:exodeoxyribonuclease VII large subunit [Desulfosudis oleivorans]|uniref:Exodeoxyribonuclease 7 large subunit n=1 Tax=Desulfosudis oleivorans (strain DSM 6200 / JCM 39069 / Hxd3) TaxID=96561 RepID=A9A0G9_DESOH|nr:exodeoxyribonuclease VII large subunit [Desulfosudis oleivorans]ABW67469.1 exodeoxyribonuclease VII, large subunit [Desulfosudis oleivorans Hxd3]
MAQTHTSLPESGIYTVSRLTGEIKVLLEKQFPIIWVEGEISNFKRPGSGHFYFTLKDSTAQVQAVMFVNQNRGLKFMPEDGMKITGLGRISVYAPRGNYQVIFEHIMPQGMGELVAAFEQLKKKLADEGLFDPGRKKPVPFLPAKVCLISSPTGAVVHDMIHVMTRRFPGIEIEILPASVQGDKAAVEIAAALALANRRADADVLVVARGGGSLEDLFAFNTETVARAVAASAIPVVSAVGHETDFTICDFVADLRAPTPSAAAELIVPVKKELLAHCRNLRVRMVKGFDNIIRHRRRALRDMAKRLIDPRRALGDALLRLDELAMRLVRALDREIAKRAERLAWQQKQLFSRMPERLTTEGLALTDRLVERLSSAMQTTYLRENRHRVDGLTQRLFALSPRAVLERGYSITQKVSDGQVIKKTGQADPGDALTIIVSDGSVRCTVDR